MQTAIMDDSPSFNSPWRPESIDKTMKQYVAFGIEILCVHHYWHIVTSFYRRLDIYHRTSVMSMHNESTIMIWKQLN
jgi:trans-aconitate methyltransferase